jgi:hypothetical protein
MAARLGTNMQHVPVFGWNPTPVLSLSTTEHLEQFKLI